MQSQRRIQRPELLTTSQAPKFGWRKRFKNPSLNMTQPTVWPTPSDAGMAIAFNSLRRGSNHTILKQRRGDLKKEIPAFRSS